MNTLKKEMVCQALKYEAQLHRECQGMKQEEDGFANKGEGYTAPRSYLSIAMLKMPQYTGRREMGVGSGRRGNQNVVDVEISAGSN